MATMAELDKLVAELADERKEKEANEETLKRTNARIGTLERLLLAILTEHGHKSYHSPHGMVIKSTRFSVTMPREPEKREAFFAWLKEQQVFDEFVTVNHQKLNSLYKERIDAAAEAGDIDFAIPGIAEPVTMDSLQFRKAK